MFESLKCVICKHGETFSGETTVTLQRGETTVIFKKVEADICDNCGEYYLDEGMTDRLLQKAETAVTNGAEVEILSSAG